MLGLGINGRPKGGSETGPLQQRRRGTEGPEDKQRSYRGEVEGWTGEIVIFNRREGKSGTWKKRRSVEEELAGRGLTVTLLTGERANLGRARGRAPTSFRQKWRGLARRGRSSTRLGRWESGDWQWGGVENRTRPCFRKVC